MEDDKLYELFKKYASELQIRAFNEGFEMGRKVAKEEYDGK